MKFIDVKKYRGFKTEFFVLTKTEKFLFEQKIDIKNYLMDDHSWYEHFMFELLDDLFGNLDKYKNFKVVFYGIIKDKTGENFEGFIEEFKFDELKILNDFDMPIHFEKKSPFAIRGKILISNGILE